MEKRKVGRPKKANSKLRVHSIRVSERHKKFLTENVEVAKRLNKTFRDALEEEIITKDIELNRKAYDEPVFGTNVDLGIETKGILKEECLGHCEIDIVGKPKEISKGSIMSIFKNKLDTIDAIKGFIKRVRN